MKRTTLEQFREELLATGAYETPPERCAEKVRKPGLMTRLGMSWSILGVFVHCGLREHFGLLDTDKWAHFCFRAQQKAEGYGTKFHLEGWDNRKAYDGPVVYLSNHMSSLETILLPYVLLSYGPFCTIVKQSLSHIPGVTKAAAHMGLIPIGRANPREDLMTVFNVGGERIKQGNSMLIFAQGTRVPVFARKGWSSIGTKLAEKAGVPVVPIAVKTDMQPTRPEAKGLAKDFGPVDPSKDVRLACGPVLTGSSREMLQSSFDWIATKLESWGMPTER